MEPGPFQVQIYGSFHMERPDGAPVAFPTKSAAAVIAYLALNHKRSVARGRLAEALWPDQDRAAAMTNLRTAIHRVRKSIPEKEVILGETQDLRLDFDVLTTDHDTADRHHRAYLLAANQPEGVSSLAAEWEIRKKTLLEGWDWEWVLEARDQANIVVGDVGSELAVGLETAGDRESAAEVWRDLVERMPQNADALKNSLRLEYELRGKGNALILANTVVEAYRTETGIEMPQELQKMVQAIRGGFYETIPKPELIRTKGELLLLARMFESNLRSNRTEALAMLAREVSAPANLVHPRTMLSLLDLALTQTDGVAPERVQVAVQACTLASWCSQFDVGHHWANFVLERCKPSDPNYATVLSIKGHMHFEQRQYALGEEHLEHAIEIFKKQGRVDEMLRAMSRLAGSRWNRLLYEPAKAAYLEILDAVEDRSDPTARALKAMASYNLCFLYTAMLEWSLAIEAGEECKKHFEHSPIYAHILPAPLGLALFGNGQKEEGLRELSRGVGFSYREGMWRFNQIAIDLAASALLGAGHQTAAQCIFEANSDHRATIQHLRSPAELKLIQHFGNVDAEGKRKTLNPLKGQSAATLSQWVCEECDRALRAIA